MKNRHLLLKEILLCYNGKGFSFRRQEDYNDC